MKFELRGGSGARERHSRTDRVKVERKRELLREEVQGMAWLLSGVCDLNSVPPIASMFFTAKL